MSAEQDQHSDDVGRIIRAAGRRQDAPADTRARVLAAATATLDARLLRARRRRSAWRMTAAAAAVLAAIGLGWLATPDPPAAAAAIGASVHGEVQFRARDGDPWSPLLRDARLLAGSELRTGRGGRAGLTLAQGASLRLDELTDVHLAGPARVEIAAGTVYVDSRDAAHGVEVITPLAVTRDVGTQFEVRYRGREQRVRVREGSVLVALGDRQYRSDAGEQLLLSPAGDVRRTAIATGDASWEWVQQVAQAPDIDNRPLSELLEWVTRETGRALRYESAAVRTLAQTTILHGSIGNLEPLPAATTVLATTDLDLEILADGSLLLRNRAGGDHSH